MPLNNDNEGEYPMKQHAIDISDEEFETFLDNVEKIRKS